MYDLHIIKTPAGTYTFVGQVPKVLCAVVPATKADVMGGRAFKDASGETQTYKVPAFDSEAEALDYCKKYQVTATLSV